jgi:DedD protein
VDILLKQRLVGAIVIISLGVIFLPMLFTGREELGDAEFESSMPSEPVYEIKAPSLTEKEAPEPPPLEDPQLSEPSTMPAPEVKQTTRETAKTEHSEPLAADTAATASKQESKQKAVVQKPATTEKPSPAPKPKSTPSAQSAAAQPIAEAPAKTDEIHGWVVQVGSFSKQSNAEALRDRLRAKGMPSFVMQASSDGKTVYRVRVGPSLDRESAESLQRDIKQQTQLSGFVTRYP